MTADPAIEAAQRAWRDQTGSAPLGDDNYTIRVRTLSAREALAPLRELHRPFTRTGYPGADGRTVCNHCLGPIDWPCATARLVYPAQELN